MSGWTRRTIIAAAMGTLAFDGQRPGSAATPPDALTLHRGINVWPWFSLTREFPAPRTDYAWPPFQQQRSIPRATDLARLRDIGFDFVRLPVDPGPFLAFDGPRRSDLMASLFDAAAEILSAGLKLVLNLQANDGTHFWVSQRMVGGLEAPGFSLYRTLVSDVAKGLATFDQERVALEPVNEPPQDCRSAEWDLVQDNLLLAARTSAPHLTLIATGACGSMIPGLQALDPAPVLALGRVMFTFHFYEPYLFSHQGAPWMREPVYRALNAVPWPASTGSLDATLAAVRLRMAQDGERSAEAKRSAYAETEKVLKAYFDAQPARPFVDHYLDGVLAWARQNGLRPQQIMMGEFGALRSDAGHVAAHAADRARYIRDVRESAEACGFPWAFWNLFDSMGLMDDETRALDLDIVSALGLRASRG